MHKNLKTKLGHLIYVLMFNTHLSSFFNTPVPRFPLFPPSAPLYTSSIIPTAMYVPWMFWLNYPCPILARGCNSVYRRRTTTLGKHLRNKKSCFEYYEVLKYGQGWTSPGMLFDRFDNARPYLITSLYSNNNSLLRS